MIKMIKMVRLVLGFKLNPAMQKIFSEDLVIKLN